MNELQKYLVGKKTYLLVIVYCIVVLSTGSEPAGFGGMLSDIDADKIQQILLGMMVATAKAAWERFANSR